MAKKENTTEIKPIAEVKMGHVTARFSAEALEDLYYLKDFVEKDLMDTIRKKTLGKSYNYSVVCMGSWISSSALENWISSTKIKTVKPVLSKLRFDT